MKICTKCNQEKEATIDNFYKGGGGKLQSWCKTCHKLHGRTWIQNHPEKRKQYRSKYRQNGGKEKENQYNLRYMAMHPEKMQELRRRYYEAGGKDISKAWWLNNPERAKHIRIAAGKRERSKRYGILVELYEEIMAGPCCQICGLEEGKFHFDHDHATGVPRGKLCHSCNVGLGHFKDNPLLLYNAIMYLDTTKEVVNNGT